MDKAYLEQFVRTIMHDMAAPLRHVREFTGILLEDLAPHITGEQRDYARMVENAVNLAEARLQALRHFAQVSMDASPHERIDSNDLLARAKTTLADKITASQATIHTENLPMILGNLSQCETIFTSLLDNSLAYGSPQQPIEISISAERQDYIWRFCIADNGIGIAPALHEKIFLPFKRLSGGADSANISLALCKRLVELHGGTMEIDSQTGQGARFYFTLPAYSL